MLYATKRMFLRRASADQPNDHPRNRRLAFCKRLVRGSEAPETAAADAPASAERGLLAREKLATLWAAVAALPLRQRTALVLRYAEEMPLGQVAEVMNLEVGTVKSHLSRALAAFILEPGAFRVLISSSSQEQRLRALMP